MAYDEFGGILDNPYDHPIYFEFCKQTDTTPEEDKILPPNYEPEPDWPQYAKWLAEQNNKTIPS